MLVTWEQIDELRGYSQWTIATTRAHASFQQCDSWAEYGQLADADRGSDSVGTRCEEAEGSLNYVPPNNRQRL